MIRPGKHSSRLWLAVLGSLDPGQRDPVAADLARLAVTLPGHRSAGVDCKWADALLVPVERIGHPHVFDASAGARYFQQTHALYADL